MKRTSIIALAAAFAVGPAWISTAAAQGYGQQQQQQPAQQQQSFSESDLESYAAAAQEVQQISQTYLPEIQSAKSPQDQQTIRDEATQKMVEAIEQEGLSVQQYNQITSAVRVDPDTAAKVEQHMK